MGFCAPVAVRFNSKTESNCVTFSKRVLRRRPHNTRRIQWYASDLEPSSTKSKDQATEATVSPSLSSESQTESVSTFDGDSNKLSPAELRGHVISTLGWISVAAAVTPVVGFTRGWQEALEFVTAYVVEYSLSVDNLFVFLLIFGYFNVPKESQERVLGWGIFGAMFMRGVMIVAGAELTRRFEGVTLVFAAFLLYTASKLLLEGDGDEEEEDLSNNGVVKFARGLVEVSEKFDGDRFFTLENGVRMATPLFLVLICVELSDVIFALDSVPAVLGISEDTVVIYLSNILAILGLRSLFFILSDSIGGLRFLSKSLAIVLGFVGVKMVTGVFGYPVPILPSLGVIVGTLGAGVGLSFALPKKEAS